MSGWIEKQVAQTRNREKKVSFNLKNMGLMEIGHMDQAVNKFARECRDAGEFANTLVQFFFDQLIDDQSQERSCVLARFFMTRQYAHLDEHVQEIVNRSLAVATPDPHMKCLTLLATRGLRPAWNDPAASLNHLVIPFIDKEFITNIPMISQLLKQIGLDIDVILNPDPELLVDLGQQSFGVFFVRNALGSQYIPAQKEFVEPMQVKSVLGFGGILPDGNLFAIILFSRTEIPIETTKLFRVITLNIKVGLFAIANRQDMAQRHTLQNTHELRHQIFVHQELLREYRETIIHQTELLQKEIAFGKQQAAIIKRNYDSRMVINKLLETTLISQKFEQMLGTLLDIIFTVPWFALYPKGSVFLVNQATGMLELIAHRNFGQELLGRCQRLRLGECLCGKAALSGKLLFSSQVDARHEIQYPGMPDHGHYCVPIKSGTQILGVINLYVNANHRSEPDELEFLESVAYTMAGIIERKKLEIRIQQQAELDELTGLPNRVLFRDRLELAINTAKRNRTEVILMFLDLDGFKKVNDTLGHKAGDQLLQEAARRISACVRTSDTVARLGGDEFTIILPKLTHLFYVEYVIRRILEELARPFFLVAGEGRISGSIGVAIYPRDAVDPNDLLTHADMAMYHAKHAGRSTFRFFEPAMTSEAMERLKIEKSLQQGLERNEFLLHYQPKVNPVSGEVVGMEALVRWQQPDEGIVSPAKFIPVAEQTGLIVAIGNQVLTMACRQNKNWIDAGFKPCRVSVNLSVRQLKQGEKLFATISGVLAATGLPPEYLELEITESMMMENIKDAVTTLERIRGLGVWISVDDFGTGYSSLGSLKNLPIQILKIDRSFISGLGTNQDLQAIVSAILHMARQLNLRVVAEGAETSEEVKFLKEMGCDEIQGFYYAKPMPAMDFAKILQNGRI
ncbi:MAG: EAL domain-containing protein [Magnetococcus sp. DMHC-1]|nr:EAL domain-containing protein [Magnetococcales bacterium]